MLSASATVYRPRKPQSSAYYRCVEDHLETFVQVYEQRFERRYGFWRPYLQKVITRYLGCGDLHHGFARVKCPDCQHEYLLAFSCKRRHFCPSCHQKRVVEFGEWLCSHVLKKVPHRHFVFSIPKILRRYFLYDRDLLSDLSRCAWESLKVFLRKAVPEKDPIPGAVIAIQTFGDFLGFNPRLHVLVTDGCFYGKGMFRVAPPLDLKKLEAIFRHKVFKMLLAKGRITQDLIAMLSNWRHSGFQVFCGQRIFPRDETAMENLARYIIPASFSQESRQRRDSICQNRQRWFTGRKTELKKRVSMLWSGWPPCVPISRTGANRWFGTMATTVTSAGENGKKPKTTGSPASRRVESSTWKPIKARRNTGRTGPGSFRKSEPVPDWIGEGRSLALSKSLS